MATLTLPAQSELIALFRYDPETGVLAWRVDCGGIWGNRIKAGSIVSTVALGYLIVGIKGKRYRVHRVIWKMMTGEDPVSDIDHIDRDRINNRWANLRLATPSQNKMNIGLKSNNKSGYKGVYWSNSKHMWAAQIVKDKKKRHLGFFDDASKAGEAYQLAAREMFGDFACSP